MSLLCPTPPERLVDAQGRPYFLWDTDMTLVRFKELLCDGEEVVRTHLVCKLMRQAKPDDVFTFVSLKEICELWPVIESRLGRTRDFWTWTLTQWGVLGPETTVVDLVADPVTTIEDPDELSRGKLKLRVDTKHEILVNKLCTLVQRSELRDLFDVQQLLASGGDLVRALGDAPKKDGGFSPMTLSWLLGQLSIGPVGEAEGWSSDQVRELGEFRDSLVGKLKGLTQPDGE